MYRRSENHNIVMPTSVLASRGFNIEFIRIFHKQKELASKLQSKVASEPS